MANNRMYLVCRGCNKAILMGKVLGGGYYNYNEDMTKILEEFYEEHTFCDTLKEVNSENQFELSYESANDEGISEYKPNLK